MATAREYLESIIAQAGMLLELDDESLESHVDELREADTILYDFLWWRKEA